MFALAGLSQQHRGQLRRMGVEMDAEEARWAWHYRVLEGFKTQQGHVDVPLSGTEGCQSLGRWLYTQKQKYARGQLPHARLRMLQGLGVELPKSCAAVSSVEWRSRSVHCGAISAPAGCQVQPHTRGASQWLIAYTRGV